ncbi:Rieske (2Fe-2S) protein [Subtercola lobariae]|uniref:Rieske domain-containing protein n=1 Tax=Subtercola lobariae TaxID=1588641 RepID=A0A917BH94_9MICO|nr:Rieske (2Fe-2S) protein [Subtercola lobariae]GGF41315.1 hypothetical protein GCM10011399_37500 [Subtercola lobariae]
MPIGAWTSAAILGLATVSGAGFLGGHLSYRQAAGANHVEDLPHPFPTGWQHLARLDELTDSEFSRRVVADQPLLVFKRGENVDVIAKTCSHLSAPLNEGELSYTDRSESHGEAAAGGCVTCPWHGSVFSLITGKVVHGPATSPQPRFDVRITEVSSRQCLPAQTE